MSTKPMPESPRPAPPQPPRAPVRGMRHLATALAVLALGGCGAALGMGGATTATAATGAGASDSNVGGERTPPAMTFDPNDPITAGTDRANAATPDNAGRAKTYPHGHNFTDEQLESYGHEDDPRGDGYYVSLRKCYAILAGYTVEIATKRARLTGFDGIIRVTEADKFDPSCGDGIVCSISPQEWQGSSDPLILYVNRHMKISSPD